MAEAIAMLILLVLVVAPFALVVWLVKRYGKATRLQQENAHLSAMIDASSSSRVRLAPSASTSEAVHLRELLDDATQKIEKQRQEISRLQSAQENQPISKSPLSLFAKSKQNTEELLVNTDDILMLQEVGIYYYKHPAENSEEYKIKLEQLREYKKDLIKTKKAVSANMDWTVEGSKRKGNKLVTDFSKLMLSSFNAEVADCVSRAKPHNRASLIDRLNKAEQRITKLGSLINIHIDPYYVEACIKEVELTTDYWQMKAEEKEAQREERERLREEAKVQREIEQRRQKLKKEKEHFQNTLAKLRENPETSVEEITEMESKIAEVEEQVKSNDFREANSRAGYVYIISNIGSFGPDVVKIGMTRRLEPMDRVNELGDASVPFRFDVHSIIFSEDAVSLENELHKKFAEHRVNKVNMRREYFYITPLMVKEHLMKLPQHKMLEYVDEPEAAEWRQSGSRQHT